MSHTLHARGLGSRIALRVFATLALCLTTNAWAGSTVFIATNATTPVTLGQSISDSATVTGSGIPTGTVSFNVYGPDDASCAGGAAYNSVSPLNGSGVATAGDFTPTSAGTYRWTAVYSGDANNTPVTAACNATNSTSVVAKASPTISNSATTSATLGQAIADSATLASGSTPTGTITFNLYGPNDATCAGGTAFSGITGSISGNGSYSSGNFTPAVAGTYRWTATYNGDNNNNSVSSACNSSFANSVINPVVLTTPTLSTQATAAANIGNPISDSATLTGGSAPTGTITFNLYGPDDATCTGTVAYTNAKTVSDNNTYTSDNFTPSVAGTYRWIASYSGDANNNAVSGTCGDANETSLIITPVLANPTISSSATTTAFIGETISDSATLAGGTTPTGNITFNLYGPNNPTCSGAPVFTSSNAVNGSGIATSGNFSPTTAGTYLWIASYGGDSNNNAVAGVCGAVNETSTISDPLSISPNPVNFGKASPVSPGEIRTITVSNQGSVAITINSAVVTGDPDFAISSTTCPTSPATLAAGASCVVNVLFVPTAAEDLMATVTLNSNIGIHTVTLIGTGAWKGGGGSMTLLTLLILSIFALWRLIKREQIY